VVHFFTVVSISTQPQHFFYKTPHPGLSLFLLLFGILLSAAFPTFCLFSKNDFFQTDMRTAQHKLNIAFDKTFDSITKAQSHVHLEQDKLTFSSFLAQCYYTINYPQSAQGIPASFLVFVDKLCRFPYVTPGSVILALYYLQQVRKHESVQCSKETSPPEDVPLTQTSKRNQRSRLSATFSSLKRNIRSSRMEQAASPFPSPAADTLKEFDTDRLVTALMLANKFLHDIPPSIGLWSRTTLIPKAHLSRSEKHFLACMDYNISLTVEQFNSWATKLVRLMLLKQQSLEKGALALPFDMSDVIAAPC
jgi:hypothetical protein